MRLIDADDIKYQLLKPNTNPTLWCVSKDAVDLMPTVDAVPVVHGKWVEKTGVLNDATFWWYECSECGERPLKCYGSDSLSRFCPNCGAKMDEDNSSMQRNASNALNVLGALDEVTE